MSSLVLDSLEIENFRAFRHLKINHLGRVNLIVGKNNVGKSCLLEALMLYAGKGEPAIIMELLENRDEFRLSDASRVDGGTKSTEEWASALKHLFHGRRNIQGPWPTIRIGPVGAEDIAVAISASWSAWRETGLGHRRLELFETESQAMVPGSVLSVVVKVGHHITTHFPLDQGYRPRFQRDQDYINEERFVFVPSRGASLNDVGMLWDSIALSNLERDVLAALQILAPNVEGVNLLGSKDNYIRSPFVRVVDFDNPISLRSMGEGMNRIFGLALALVNAKDGLLLIDEIDTGIHYSVQPDMWRLIFEVAHRLNVQVFATSHSWDCIQAFQQAAHENTQEEGVLIRLQNKNGDVVPVLFDEEELNVVAREMIEVR